ncbi:MAG: TonB family protein, partial [Deltaproteobacteria bacterium]|nr:TonB family protein [Deltaproteobacteria bacterium]
RMTRRKENTERGEAARLRGPLFWSVTAHLLAVFSLLVLGAGGAAGPFRGVADVFLVGATGGDRAAPKRFVPRSAPGETQVPAILPPTTGALPDASSRAKRMQGTTAAKLPQSGKEASGPGVGVAGNPVALAGEMHSREGPGPTVFSPDSGERTRAVAQGEWVAGISPRRAETGRSGGGTGPVPGDGEKGSAPEEETMGAIIGPPGPASVSPGPGRAWENSRAGAGTSLLRERIQSRIVYPEEAVRRGQQGDVLLRIRIGAEGVPKEIRIARSSGARLLDDAARRGVVRAAPLPSAPGWVEVPVHFRLR